MKEEKGNLQDRIKQFEEKTGRVPIKKEEGRQITASKAMADLVAGLLVGGCFGYFLDNLLDTMPIFFFIFFLLGFLGGVYNMLRY